MKHQRDIQCPVSRGTVYPFDVSYSALLVTKLTETSVASVYLYLIYSATGAFDLCVFIHLGLQITGNDRPLIIGESATLICSSDLDVSKIEWFAQHNEVLVNSTRQSITLVFNQVSLDMHGAQYTCHVTSPYGTQERNITVITEGELSLPWV